jgi:DNA-directed RNA polymerase specialized sigma24 family protein
VLRRLARDLVGSASVDDVLQDAAIEVMRAPPQQPGPLLRVLPPSLG